MAALSPVPIPGRPTFQEIANAARQPPSSTRSGGCVVSVRSYTRTRNGHTEQVGGYQRNNPNCAAQGAEVNGATPEPVPVQFMPFLLTPKPPAIIPRGSVKPLNEGPVEYMQRVPRQSGKEAATDTPSWARGLPRIRGESATRYAERLLDEKYGGRKNWDGRRDSRGSDSEFSKIKKFGERAFKSDILNGFNEEEEPHS